MSAFYHAAFYQPLLNALVVLYNTIAFHDLGVAIIILTAIIRIVLYPLFKRSVRHQLVMQELQSKIAKIKKDHSGDIERQTKETMALYKEHNINPFSGFLFLIIQLPILFALYQIFLQSFNPEIFRGLYSFVHAPAAFGNSFLGLINLEKRSILMVLLAAAAQYFQASLALPKKKPGEEWGPGERMTRQMIYITPVITVIIFINFPAAVSLYWLASALVSIWQQHSIQRAVYHGSQGISQNNGRAPGV